MTWKDVIAPLGLLFVGVLVAVIVTFDGKESDTDRARSFGRECFIHGVPAEANPCTYQNDRKAWLLGWMEEKFKKTKETK
jgi:ribosome modulation factor